MDIREELEVLTGKLINGNITPIVYDIISKSPYCVNKDTLRKELKKCVSDERAITTAVGCGKRVVNFDSFLKGCERV